MEYSRGREVLDIQYMKLLRISLLPINGWPSLKKDDQASFLNLRTVSIIIQLTVVIGEILYLHNIFGVVDFFLVGDVYITTFLTMLSLVRLTVSQFKIYGDIVRKYVTKFHLMNFKNKGTAFRQICSTIDEISYYATLIMIGMGLSGCALFNLSPMYINIKNGAFTFNRHNLDNFTLEFSVKYKYPGYDQREKFFLTTVINFYLSFLCTVTVISIDLLLLLMVFQIIGHLEVLAINLKSMPKPKTVQFITEITEKGKNVFETQIYDEGENLKITKRLQQLVDHHNVIISFTQDVSAFFGPILGCTYMFHSVSCCLLLLECSRGDPDVIVRYGPLTIIVFGQLFQISIIFELLGHKSNALIDCVYELPWQCMNVCNQKSMCLMLLRVQTPVQVSAFGLVGVGVKTMVNILKTTFSYYTFLRSM